MKRIFSEEELPKDAELFRKGTDTCCYCEEITSTLTVWRSPSKGDFYIVVYTGHDCSV